MSFLVLVALAMIAGVVIAYATLIAIAVKGRPPTLRLYGVLQLLLAVSGLTVWLLSWSVAYWIGGAEYSVRVASNQPVRAVRYCSFFTRGDAEDYLVDLNSEDEKERRGAAEDMTPAPNTTRFQIEVRTSGQTNEFGRELQYSYEKGLVVLAVLEDGRRVAKVVELPDPRTSREVEISLP